MVSSGFTAAVSAVAYRLHARYGTSSNAAGRSCRARGCELGGDGEVEGRDDGERGGAVAGGEERERPRSVERELGHVEAERGPTGVAGPEPPSSDPDRRVERGPRRSKHSGRRRPRRLVQPCVCLGRLPGTERADRSGGNTTVPAAKRSPPADRRFMRHSYCWQHPGASGTRVDRARPACLNLREGLRAVSSGPLPGVVSDNVVGGQRTRDVSGFRPIGRRRRRSSRALCSGNRTRA